MLAILSNNRQSPKFTPRQYFILYGIYSEVAIFLNGPQCQETTLIQQKYLSCTKNVGP